MLTTATSTNPPLPPLLPPHPFLQMNKQMLAWLDRYLPSPDAPPAVLELYFHTAIKFMAQEEEHLAEEERAVLEPLRGMISKVGWWWGVGRLL